MSCSFELITEHRDSLGTAASRRLRRLEGKVPIVLYGLGEPSIHLSVNHFVLSRLTENNRFYSSILTIKVGDKIYQTVLKGLKRDPVKPKILDAEFLRIDEKKPIHLHVPLHFEGEEVSPGVKQAGGIASYQLTSVALHCLPKDIPEFIKVNISTLGANETIKLSQLSLPKGVSLVPGDDRVVVTILAKRGQTTASN